MSIDTKKETASHQELPRSITHEPKLDYEFFDDMALYIWEFKNKGYPHFDTEYPEKRVEELIKLVKQNKLSHPFYPLIRKKLPKIKRDSEGRISNEVRYIFHTARIDSNLYSYYRNLLMNNYEKFLYENNINDCVIAYRKISAGNSENGNKCSIHFSNEAIEEIKNRISMTGNCSAITMDIKGFFDNLDHKIIKKTWCRVMGFKDGLLDDHFLIYKNITRYTFVDDEALEKALGIKLREIRKNQKQICTSLVFKEKVRGLLSAKNEIGIPQGTAISDVIANIYMIDFDILMNKFAKKYGGYYRRYSDDILFLSDERYREKSISFIKKLLKKTGKTLKISDKKTLISVFSKNNQGDIVCNSQDEQGVKRYGKFFEYLGLSFDGECKRIRNSTISRYHKKLSYRLKKEVKASNEKLKLKGIVSPTADQVFHRINFRKIKNRYMENRGQRVKGGFLGNFHSYVSLVAEITGNKNVLSVFNDSHGFTRRKAKKYCKVRVDKNMS